MAQTSNDEARAIYEAMYARLQAAGVTLTFSTPNDDGDDENENDG